MKAEVVVERIGVPVLLSRLFHLVDLPASQHVLVQQSSDGLLTEVAEILSDQSAGGVSIRCTRRNSIR